MAGYLLKGTSSVQSFKDALNAQSIGYTIYNETNYIISLAIPTYLGTKVIRLDFYGFKCWIGDAYSTTTTLTNETQITFAVLNLQVTSQASIFINANYLAIVANAEANANNNTWSLIFCKDNEKKYALSFTNNNISCATYCIDIGTFELVIPLIMNNHTVFDATGKYISLDVYVYNYATKFISLSPIADIKNVLKGANYTWSYESFGVDAVIPTGYTYDEKYVYNTSLLLNDALVGGNVV